MRITPGVKIAIGFVLIAVVGWFGYNFIVDRVAFSQEFDPVLPTDFTILGIDRSSGFAIIVSNRVAQLVEVGQGGLDQPGQEIEKATEGAPRKRLPLRDLLDTLKGDEEAAGKLVMVLNDINTDQLPPDPVIWDAADIQAALEGDEELRAKLVQDLNIELDGTPLEEVRLRSVMDGIVLRLPVRVSLGDKGSEPEVTAYVLEEFRPGFTSVVGGRLNERFEIDRPAIVGVYSEEAAKIFDNPKLKQNVAEALRARINPAALERMAVPVERVLQATTVIVNDDMIEEANYSEYVAGNERLYRLRIELNDEGRARLMQYARQHPNSQILLSSRGVAIAAPVISGQFFGRTVEVSKLQDEGLLQDAVGLIRSYGENQNQP
ncbi:MAG: hypothetical protein ACK4P3_04875 [Fimbriimonadaceae bacterium]